jgi:hypothetical protein
MSPQDFVASPSGREGYYRPHPRAVGVEPQPSWATAHCRVGNSAQRNAVLAFKEK